MKKFNIKINTLFYIGMALCLLACESDSTKGSRVDSLPYYSEASFTPIWLEAHSPKLDTLHKIRPFKLINQDGLIINHQTFQGKIYVTDFFFTTCPGICPKMTDNMAILQKEFKNEPDLLLLSHSVTPERDSVSVLKAYADYRNIDSTKWHLVTGSEEEIYTLGRKSYFVEEDLGLEKDIDDFLHTENFVLIDKQKHIRGIYNGLNKTSINQLIVDIKTLLQEQL